MACFCPIFQYHSEFNHYPVAEPGPHAVEHRRTHPGRPDVLDIFRDFANLRETLVPYLVEQAHRSVRTSRPLMRPLFFDHPGDEEVLN